VFSPPVSADPIGAALLPASILVGLGTLGGPVSCQHAVGVTGQVVIGPLGPNTTASPPVGPLAAARPLPVNIDAGPVANGAGAVALVSSPLSLGSDCGTSERLTLADLGTGGTIMRRFQLSDDVEVVDARIAGDARGDLAAAWIEQSGAADEPIDTLRMMRRPRGQAPETLIPVAQRRSPGGLIAGLGSVALAMDGSGRTLVAWTTDSRVLARSFSRSGASGAVQVLGACNENCAVTAADAPNGRAVIAWNSQSGSTEPGSPLAIIASVRTGPNARFGASQIVDPGQLLNGDLPGPHAAITTGGWAALEWTNSAGTNANANQPVRMAIARPGDRFGPIIPLTTNGATGTLAVRPDGEALITWVQLAAGGDSSGPVRASLVAPGGVGPPRGITLAGVPGHSPLAAFTAAGTPLVAWEAAVGSVASVGVSTHR
jgi:hypothetical protein